MVISGNRDFSMVESAPKDGFKFVRHPSSFRATLVQVSNDGWSAFMNAHENMDKIQLYMQQVPDHIKTAFKLIMKGSPRIVQRFLPSTLGQLKDIGTECVKLAKETQTKFNDVMLLMGEILESTIASHGRYNLKLFTAEAELNVSKVLKVELEKAEEMFRKRQASIDVELRKCQAAYDQALRDIPSGWEAVAQGAVRAGINLINMVTFNGFNKDKISSQFTPLAAGGGKVDIDASTALALTSMQQYSGQLAKFKNDIQNAFNGENNNRHNPVDNISKSRIAMNIWENLLSSVGSVGQKALELVKNGQGISDRLKDLYKDFPKVNVSQETKNEIMGLIDGLLEKGNAMVASNAYMSNGMSMTSPGSSGISSSAFDGDHGNERYKAYLSLELLKETQRRSDKTFEDIMKYNDEMKKLMTRMATLNLETINFKETIELIVKGIELLTGIREQWSMLIEFFSKLASRAEIALNKRLLSFVNYTDEARQEIVQYGMNEFDQQLLKEVLSKQTIDIHIECSFLYTLSSTYVDVSSQFLMTRLAGLARMLAPNNVQERQALMTQLDNQRIEAEKQIREISKQKRLAHNTLVQQRITDVNAYVQEIGGPTESDRNAVRAGIEDGKSKAKPSNLYAMDFAIN